MGYYTKHRIRIINEHNTEENLEKLVKYLCQISGYFFYIYGSEIRSYTDDDNDYGIKWYNCKQDMEHVSRYLPDLEIEVKGKGEDDVIWEMVVQDGDSYTNEADSFSDSEEEIYIKIKKQKYINNQ